MAGTWSRGGFAPVVRTKRGVKAPQHSSSLVFKKQRVWFQAVITSSQCCGTTVLKNKQIYGG